MEGENDFPSKKLLMSPNAYAVFWRGNKFLVEGVKRNAEIHGGVEENAEISVCETERPSNHDIK